MPRRTPYAATKIGAIVAFRSGPSLGAAFSCQPQVLNLGNWAIFNLGCPGDLEPGVAIISRIGMRITLQWSFLAIAMFLISPILVSVEVVSAHPLSEEGCEMPATPVVRGSASPSASPVASPSSVSPEFDQLYLDLMIVQQERVGDLARIGTLRANTRELQRLSEEIVSATESTLEQLHALRVQLYDAEPLEMGPELMAELDEIGRQQPGAGGVPGAMEIVAGNNIVSSVCLDQESVDQSLTIALIEQLDAGIVLSGTAKNLAIHDQTKAIAVTIVETDRTFEDGAIAIRDALLAGTPVATPTGGGL